jgi:CRP-like cAMP-binding protein
MSDIAIAPAEIDLAGVGLFEGLDVRTIAPAFRRQSLAAGEILWLQGSPGDSLYVITAGEIRVARRLPGRRDVELARLGPDDVMGELPLLAGGARSATAQALRPSSVLILERDQFDALSTVGDPNVLELRRRIVAVACARVRKMLARLAAMLPGDPPLPGALNVQALPAALPPRPYLSRLALLRSLPCEVTDELLARATPRQVARGQVVEYEGDPPAACYIVLNGAVEEVLRRGPTSLRVGFVCPGHAFGVLGLLDGRPAGTTAIARERCRLLAVARDDFMMVYRGAFANVVEADLVESLMTAGRALSYLGAGTWT